MHLPAFPQFDEITTMGTTTIEAIQTNKLLFNMGLANKDSASIYNLEIAFGTSFGFLLLVIGILALIVWVQRKQIVRLTAFFNGHQPEENRQLIVINREENDDNLANVNNERMRFHQNADITQVIDLIFPSELPAQHLRNKTALKAFHKSQREALKNYAAHQERLFLANQN